MGKPVKGEVRLKYRGKNLTLVLDFNALCDFEAVVGETAQTRLACLENGTAAFGDMRALLWAMLQSHHPDMSLKDAGKVIGEGMAEVSGALQAAFIAALPAEAEGRGKKPKPKTVKPPLVR
jgi:hypothetical protein